MIVLASLKNIQGKPEALDFSATTFKVSALHREKFGIQIDWLR